MDNFNSTLFSRRDTDRKVDFAVDMTPQSPHAQSRRLLEYLTNGGIFNTDENLTDCSDALAALREYSYRKLFTGTSHEDFLTLDKEDPQHIDWQLRIHEIVTETYKHKRK